MEINVTQLLKHKDFKPWYLSNSIANLGEDAGAITHRNAMSLAQQVPVVTTEEDRNKVIKDLEGYGAWELSDMESWSITRLNALIIQFIAGDIQESDIWEEGDGDLMFRDYFYTESGDDNPQTFYTRFDG